MFLFLRILNGNYRIADSQEYIETADLIKDGLYFQQTNRIEASTLLTSRPFLYPLFIYIIGPTNDIAIILLQTFIGFMNLYLSIRLFEKIAGTSSFSLFILLIILTPSVFIYTHLIMSECLITLLLLSTALLLTSSLTTKKIWAIQFILVLLCFIKPVFYLFTIINALFWAAYFIRYKIPAAISSIIPVILIVCYMSFNQYRTGYFHFSSIQTVNLINYNVFYYKVNQVGYEKAMEWRDSIYQKASEFKTFKSRSAFLIHAGNEEITAHVASYALFHIAGSIRGMIDPGRYDISTFFKSTVEKEGFLSLINNKGFSYTLKKMLQSGSIWILVLLVPVFLAGIIKWLLVSRYFYFNYKELTPGLAFLWLLLFYIILVTGPLNASRFMMPLQFVIICFAVAGSKAVYKITKHK
jgi:hypothetical protein